jgi:2-(3-amino-3-carboxypropyl)histidine synthase
MWFDFEEEIVSSFIRSHRCDRVAVQIPPGLKRHWEEISEVYRRHGVEPVVFESNFGACDLADARAKLAGCSALVHYGHSDMGLKSEIPVLYVEARVRGLDLSRIERSLHIPVGAKVGIFSTVQYIDYLQDLASVIRELGGSPIIGRHGWRTKYDGQVLGCDLQSALSVSSADFLLYFGTGRFHPLGASIATGRDVVCLDPHTLKAEKLDAEKFVRARMVHVMRSSDAVRWCVVTSTKPGQFRLALADRVCRYLQAQGKKTLLVVADLITPEILEDFSPDAAVSVACPRIPIDDQERFNFPVLSPTELRLVFEEEGSYLFDEVRREDFKF